MPIPASVPQPLTEPASVNAEGGMVIMEGPDGLAVTMTPAAAAKTGQNLMDAAERALAQARDA